MLFEDFFPTEYKDFGTITLKYENLSAVKSMECGFFYGTIKSHYEFGAAITIVHIEEKMKKLNFCTDIKIITEFKVIELPKELEREETNKE